MGYIVSYPSTEIELRGGFLSKILYENEIFYLVSKPADLPVHETKDPKRPDLTRLISEHLKTPVLRCVNRLDLGTSGIVMLGKPQANNQLLDVILSSAKKSYLFLAKGIPDWDQTRFECFLKDGNKKCSIVRSGGKKAITDFRVLKKGDGIYLGQADLVTGRRHQIRISLSALGFPILGDIVYGDLDSKEERMFLHACSFQFEWNSTLIKITDPLPSLFDRRLLRKAKI